jgi:hypothetical protein
MADPAVYDDAFAERDSVVVVGELQLPTGAVVGCDPYFCAGQPAFARTDEPGACAVEVRLVDLPDWGLRVALARIVFSSRRAERYEEAEREGTGSNAYFVESGVGSFMDVETRDAFAEVLEEHYRQNPTGNYYTDVLAPEFERHAAPGGIGRWNLHVLPRSDLNIAMFSSGLGDGSFGSFWGLDAEGEPVTLVTDFELL